MEPELVVDNPDRLGEGPLWHSKEKKLYWLDIPEGKIFRLDPATGKHELFWQGEVIGGFTFQADGSLLLFMDKGKIAILKDGHLSYLIKELPDENTNRFNDVIADPEGRVFCGTMPLDDQRAIQGNERSGTLYRLDTDGSITPILESCGIPNGMGFTTNCKQMFFTDSMDYTIYVFDYDHQSGKLSSKKPFIKIDPKNGLPDGMTVDAKGHIWSARAFGSALFRYSPDGIEEMSISFPAKLVSSVTFGGENLTDIYCTTIGGDDRTKYGPMAGALFRLKLGIQGVPDYYSRIGM